MNLLKIGATKWLLWKETASYPFTTHVATGSSSSPWINAYEWSTSGFGAKLADPSTSVAATAWGLEFHPDGYALAFGNSSGLQAYHWSASGFGAKYTNPASASPGTGNGVAFSPAGTEVIVACSATPWQAAYPWTAVSGFGTKFSDPSSYGSSNNRGAPAFTLLEIMLRFLMVAPLEYLYTRGQLLAMELKYLVRQQLQGRLMA